MGFKIGICGVGKFGRKFIHLFKAHPLVDEVVLADTMADRLATVAQENGIARTMRSLDELCAGNVDAIAIFTQRWMHAPQAIQALRAGKHVYSAVPAGVTLEELAELADTVKRAGLLYMMGETSYYRPQTIYCRQRFAKGDFGRFVYGEGQYHHDMSRMYFSYMHSGGDGWKPTASFPPMYYPTHSVSHVLSVTFRRMTEVACFGMVDDCDDGVFRDDVSLWKNVFSNESALFRTSDGGMARVNEFRRIGAGESRMTILGTLGAYEEQTDTAAWSWLGIPPEARKNGQIDFDRIKNLQKRKSEDVSHLRNEEGVEITQENLGDLPREYLGRRHEGVSSIHPVERLPKEFVGLETGHSGSHQFLVADFMEALATGKLPPNHVWQAARYNAPGIVAHESARRGGETMKIPDFGKPSAGARLIDPLSALQD